MAAYVSPLRRHPSGLWCHLIADTTEELHRIAREIGLKARCFQPGSYPHYDLRPSKRARAVKAGVVELTSRELGKKIRENRNDKTCNT